MTTESRNPARPQIPGIRGDTGHNFVAASVRDAFSHSGFDVALECPIRLADGCRDFVDVLAWRPGCTIACEVETTPRHAAENARKAVEAGLPLWIVTPNRKVREAVARSLKRASFSLSGSRIRILTLGQLPQALVDCFPCFSPADCTAENGKQDRLGATEGHRDGQLASGEDTGQ